MDCRICQTFTASPAEPGDLPEELAAHYVAFIAVTLEDTPHFRHPSYLLYILHLQSLLKSTIWLYFEVQAWVFISNSADSEQFHEISST
jgi:hypothetical protein